MSPEEREPTPDELLAMAYADGELAPAEATEFERRMRADPALSREVADLRRLELVARAVAPPEPQDAEWNRLRADPWHRLLTRGGAALFVGGLGLEAALALTGLRDGFAGGPLFVSGLVTVAGFALLFTAAWRWRRRNLPYDPYVEVKR
jgi:anti-sigma factor RsiW